MDNLPNVSEGSINISDVLAAIEQADPSYAASRNNGPEVEIIPTPNIIPKPNNSRLQTMSNISIANHQQMPYVEIIEQPASKALRFRYKCEGRSAGSIPGVNSTPENKTFPTIRVVGCRKRAIVVVSCVTKDKPYRPHPHSLVGKDACKKGVCTLEIPSDKMTVSFDKLGVQCVKKKEIEEALKLREEIRVDPFRTGFDHKRQPTQIDLNVIRLCFQVFLEKDGERGKFTIPLPPVVSEPVYDKKANSDLLICKMSHCSASVVGGMEMIILCERVTKEDIQIVFYEERDGDVIWEGYGDFQPTHVHKQVAISFRTPRYKNQQVQQVVNAYIQLKRPSDHMTSEPLPFQFIPLDDPDSLKRKRLKIDSNMHLLDRIQNDAGMNRGAFNPLPMYPEFNVKIEPQDRLSPYGGSIAPSPPMFMQGNPSGLRPKLSPRRTPSPMEYSLNTNQQQLLQPMVQQNAPSPIVMMPDPMPDPLVFTTEPMNNFSVNNSSMISNVIGNAMNIENVMDEMPQQNYNANCTPFDNVDLTSLNISDIVREVANEGNAAAGAVVEESGMTDSFNTLTKKTMQELCSLNNMFKTSTDNTN